MRVRIQDRSQLGRLVDYLRRCECTISFRGGELDVRPRHLPVDEALRYEELELASFLRVWTMMNPDAAAELVSNRRRREAS